MGVAGFLQLSACPRSATVQQQQQLLRTDSVLRGN